MRTFNFILGCAAAALIACGGRTDQKYGLEGPTVGETPESYPVGDYGYDVGNVLPNVAFLGWEHLDPSTKIDPNADSVGRVRFADYYDPDGSRGLSYLVVVVQVAWCGPSNDQDDATNGANFTGWNTSGLDYATQYAPNGVRFMTLLQQGPTFGVDATLDDLRLWVTHHEARTTQALVSGAEMMLDVVGAAWPYNIIVDLQTMHIVATWVGFDYANKTLNDLISARARIRGMTNH